MHRGILRTNVLSRHKSPGRVFQAPGSGIARKHLESRGTLILVRRTRMSATRDSEFQEVELTSELVNNRRIRPTSIKSFPLHSASYSVAWLRSSYFADSHVRVVPRSAGGSFTHLARNSQCSRAASRTSKRMDGRTKRCMNRDKQSERKRTGEKERGRIR